MNFASLEWIDISRIADLKEPQHQTECFFIPTAKSEALTWNGRVVGDVLQGNSVNCETITINPHGNCTHTEGIGHITKEKKPVSFVNPLLKSLLVTIPLVSFSESGDSYTAANDPADK